MPSYLSAEPTQSILPIDGAPHSDGPACRCARCTTRELVDEPRPVVDERQCYLPGVAGVRIGAEWRRHSAEGPHVPWTQLELRMRGIAKRRGRTWSERDRDTMRQVELQTWGVVELGARSVVIPPWMRAPTIDTPNGELALGKRGKPLKAPQRMMLAIVWSALERGTGGVYLSRAQWCEVLGVSLRTVDAYREQLEDAGLIRVIRTHAPASFGDAGARRGSQDAKNLYRIGPALDCIALAAFEAPFVRYPRRQGIRRDDARELGAVLRDSARSWGRDYQHAHHQRRAATVQRSRAASGGIVSRGVQGRSPVGAAQRSRAPDPMCAGPAENAILPAHPSRGVLGGAAALRCADGAAPLYPAGDDASARCSAAPSAAPAPRPSTSSTTNATADRPTSVAVVRSTSSSSTSRASATTQRDRASESAPSAVLCEHAPRQRTLSDSIAEAARAYGFATDSAELAGTELGDERSNVGPRRRAPPISRSSSSTTLAPRSGVAEARSEGYTGSDAGDQAGSTPARDDAAHERLRAALASLERECLRGAPLFDQPTENTRTTAGESDRSSTTPRRA